MFAARQRTLGCNAGAGRQNPAIVFHVLLFCFIDPSFFYLNSPPIAFWAARGRKEGFIPSISPRFTPFYVNRALGLFSTLSLPQLAHFHRILLTHALVLSATEEGAKEKHAAFYGIRTPDLPSTATFNGTEKINRWGTVVVVVVVGERAYGHHHRGWGFYRKTYLYGGRFVLISYR